MISLAVTKNVLSYIKGLTIKLQGKWQDIARVFKDIKLVKESLSRVRGSIDTFHCRWSLALKVNIQLSIPRTTIRQTQRTNTPAATPLEYYINVRSLFHSLIIFCLNLMVVSVILVTE